MHTGQICTTTIPGLAGAAIDYAEKFCQEKGFQQISAVPTYPHVYLMLKNKFNFEDKFKGISYQLNTFLQKLEALKNENEEAFSSSQKSWISLLQFAAQAIQSKNLDISDIISDEFCTYILWAKDAENNRYIQTYPLQPDRNSWLEKSLITM